MDSNGGLHPFDNPNDLFLGQDLFNPPGLDVFRCVDVNPTVHQPLIPLRVEKSERDGENADRTDLGAAPRGSLNKGHA